MKQAIAEAAKPGAAMSILRWSVVCAVISAFVAAALAHDEPVVLLVGLFPVAWLAVEFVWRAFEHPSLRTHARTRASLRRTGMRRGPKGLANFW